MNYKIIVLVLFRDRMVQTNCLIYIRFNNSKWFIACQLYTLGWSRKFVVGKYMIENSPCLYRSTRTLSMIIQLTFIVKNIFLFCLAVFYLTCWRSQGHSLRCKASLTASTSQIYFNQAGTRRFISIDLRIYLIVFLFLILMLYSLSFHIFLRLFLLLFSC